MASLNQLLQEISILPHEYRQAEAAYDHLIEAIISKSEAREIPSVADAALVGSVSRGTKPAPLDDIDVLVQIGSARTSNDPRFTYWITQFGSHSISPFLTTDGYVSSILITNSIRDAMKVTYPRSEVRRSGEVSSVYLSSYELTFDIIPAFWIENQNYYIVPQGGGSIHWKATNPVLDGLAVRRLDTQFNGYVSSLAILLKHWFGKRRVVSPRSFYIESLMVQQLPCHAMHGMQVEFSKVLSRLAESPLNATASPSGIGDLLQSGLDSEEAAQVRAQAAYDAWRVLEAEADWVSELWPS